MKTKKILSVLLACAVLCIYSCSKKPNPKVVAKEKNKEAMQKVTDAFMSGNTDSLENYVQ